MGNFYTNLVAPTSDAGPIVAALDARGGRAYVASSGRTTFVYDERCDDQDLDELRRLAERLSRDCRVPVLAACNHDDDVLWLALAEQGPSVDVYDSAPGYFDGDESPPRIAHVDRLCAAFGAAGAVERVRRLLAKPRSTYSLEVDRHRDLMRALRVESDAGFLGYGYVRRGELAEFDGAVRLVVVGGAPEPGSAPSIPSVPNASRPGPSGSPASEFASPESAALVRRTSAALALSEIEIPPELAPVLGRGRMNGFTAYMHLQRYVMKHAVLQPAGDVAMFRFDEAAARMLGTDGCSMPELMTVLADKLGVWDALDPKDRAAIEADDPQVFARATEGLVKKFPTDL